LSYIKQTGSLNYLSVNTRPDITLTTNRLSEANQGPSEQHLQLLKHLFRYLIGLYNLSLRYGRKFPISNLQLRAYGDASFADRIDTRFSTAGHIVFLAGSPILWKSKKQTLVTLSSTEAEFVNLTPTASSLLWVHQILKDAGYPQPMPLVLFTDSQNARLITLNPLISARTRHIDIRYKWIIDRTKKGDFNIQHVSTTNMVADGLTKPLNRIKHIEFVKQLGLCIPPTEK